MVRIEERKGKKKDEDGENSNFYIPETLGVCGEDEEGEEEDSLKLVKRVKS